MEIENKIKNLVRETDDLQRQIDAKNEQLRLLLNSWQEKRVYCRSSEFRKKMSKSMKNRWKKIKQQIPAGMSV